MVPYYIRSLFPFTSDYSFPLPFHIRVPMPSPSFTSASLIHFPSFTSESSVHSPLPLHLSHQSPKIPPPFSDESPTSQSQGRFQFPSECWGCLEYRLPWTSLMGFHAADGAPTCTVAMRKHQMQRSIPDEPRWHTRVTRHPG